MKPLLGLILLLVLNSAPVAQTSDSFESFRNQVRSHWSNGDQGKSIELLESNRGKFVEPREQHTIIYYLSLLYFETGNYDDGFGELEKGLERDFFFSFGPALEQEISNHPGGSEVIARNAENRSASYKRSSAIYQVILPEAYDKARKLPVFYFFHGNNSSLDSLKSEWSNVDLSTEIIVVLVQSPYPRSNFSFDWIGDPRSHASFKGVHKEISGEYRIDKAEVMVGGFSNGGRMAIDLFTKQAFPIRGYIAFNPSKPSKFGVRKPQNSQKGVIITGEKDYMLAKQIEMANSYLERSFRLRLVVLPNHGHEYPAEFSNELDSSLKFLLSK